jgi:hypothetical protein
MKSSDDHAELTVIVYHTISPSNLIGSGESLNQTTLFQGLIDEFRL